MTTQPNLSDFQTPEQIADDHPQFSAKTISWWLRNRHNNGLVDHVRKVGKKLYLHRPGFATWINQQVDQ